MEFDYSPGYLPSVSTYWGAFLTPHWLYAFGAFGFALLKPRQNFGLYPFYTALAVFDRRRKRTTPHVPV
jgi:hypothetical protein